MLLDPLNSNNNPNNQTSSTMKRNIYYRTVVGRQNKLKIYFLLFVLNLSSWPKMVIEIFIRKNFGERYFSFAAIVLCSFLMAFMPLYLDSGQYGHNAGDTVIRHSGWYLFTALFLGFGIKRKLEIAQAPGTFDFERFSLSIGDLEPFFERLWVSILGFLPNPRIMQCYLEPLPFFLIGLIFMPVYAPLGLLFTSCSVIYGLAYQAEYTLGDTFILDIIDEIIMNEQTHNIMVRGMKPSQTKGADMRFSKPTDISRQKDVAEWLNADDGRGEAAAPVI